MSDATDGSWHAGLERPRGTYPKAWGRPVGVPGSETRVAWVRAHVRSHGAGSPVRRLRELEERVRALDRLFELKLKLARLH